MNDIQLTDYEIDVLKLIAKGFSNKELAKALEVETQSIKSYVYRIRRKLCLPDRRAMQALSPEEIKAYQRLAFPLTTREHDIALLVAQGLNNDQVANRLDITTSTMEKHMMHIFDKLHITSRVQLTLYVLKADWIRLEDIDMPWLRQG